jgi:HD-GYP domain-containing protein (c-di-GMP phosphodiesterase class II)
MSNNKPATIASVMLFLFLTASVWLVLQYVEAERERDMLKWQDRLSILAESQKRSIENWLDTQANNLKELAENPLMQIYLTLGAASEDDLSETQRGQMGHLRNLVAATARHMGVFTPVQPISSNQAESSNDGIGVFDGDGHLLLSTRNFPQPDENIDQAIRNAKSQLRLVFQGIYKGAGNQPRLAIAVPVSEVQATRQSHAFPGFVVAVINPEHSLYNFLTQHWLTTASDESILVGGDNKVTTYLSPLTDGYQLCHQIPSASDRLAANFARFNTGSFASRLDYRGKDVLVTARRIDNTDWTLLQKIDESEALRESRAHQGFVLTVFLLVVFFVTVSFIAIWRHSTSVRLKKTTALLEAGTALLNSVGDNIRDHIFLLGVDEKIIFINAALSDCIGIPQVEIIGRSLHHIFSMETVESLLELRRAGTEEDIRNRVMQLVIADAEHSYHVSVVPLKHGEYRDSLLFVLHDITGLKLAQDRHNRLLEGIISTLVRATDMHDPHCAHHSERTREVAVAVAGAMGLAQPRITALAMASLLANIGKLYLPREILTKMEPLTEDEERMLRKHVLYCVEILQGLEFDGPVVDIIAQKNEQPDGSGYPKGLTRDEIMPEAKILAAANAFVAMSSARAYRQGMPVNEVLDVLLSMADAKYDRHVIAALFHIAENRSDWKNWRSADASE